MVVAKVGLRLLTCAGLQDVGLGDIPAAAVLGRKGAVADNGNVDGAGGAVEHLVGRRRSCGDVLLWHLACKAGHNTANVHAAVGLAVREKELGGGEEGTRW